MREKPVVVWLRQDLRLADHPALSAAVATGAQLLPIYVLDEVSGGRWAPGAASRWWLHMSLAGLSRSIARIGGTLVLRRGAAADVVAALADEVDAAAVYCSRSYEPWAREVEASLKSRLEKQGVALKRYAGALLHEPDRLLTKAGAPYKVYTPFWRALSQDYECAVPLHAPSRLVPLDKAVASDDLDAWRLLPTKPDWADGLRKTWHPGEAGARKALAAFVDSRLVSYAADRNRPAEHGTSRLSPHLHFGEISPRQCWRAVELAHGAGDAGRETFLKELAWREFSHHLLFHFPDLPEAPFRKEFEAFPWAKTRAGLAAWKKGATGYPIVDAGMRELWATGWMHNRVRMIVASFLIKDLLVPWQKGEAWFWDTLVDADLANNAASWQWVAGSGADAAPYFRIFNPVTQGEKFDPAGDYVRRWVPEIARLPADAIHAPWLAPPAVLASAGVKLGSTYPEPIVDHAAARERALEAFGLVKAQNSASA